MTSREKIYKAAKDAGLTVETAEYQRLTHGDAWPVAGGWTVRLTDGSGHLGWDADEVIESIIDHAANASLERAARSDDTLQDLVRQAIGHLRGILEVLGPCDHFDHHGYCQTHFIESPCRVGKAREFLESLPNRGADRM